MAAKKLTPQDLKRIQEYLAEMKELEAAEPDYQFDFGPSADAWEAWNEKGIKLTEQYSDVIRKAVLSGLVSIDQPTSTAAILEAIISSSQPQKPSPRSAAIEKGALMTLGGHIASYSTDGLWNALTGFCIMRLPESVKDPKDVFDETTGKLDMLMMQDKRLEGITTIHTAFLMAIVQAVSSTQGDDGGNTITLYLPAICRELKIDPRDYSKRRPSQDEWEQLEIPGFSDMRLNAVLNILKPFDPLVGRTPDGSYYRLLTFISYEADSETLTVSTPYLFKLKAIADRAGGQPSLNRLLRGNVVNEPNRAAVELANRILTGIVTRGVRADYKTYKTEPRAVKKTVTSTGKDGKRTTTTTVYDTTDQPSETPQPSKTVTYTVKYSTLINDCPQLKRELEEIEARGKAERDLLKSAAEEHREPSAEELEQARAQDRKTVPQRINKKLQDVFTAAFRIIAEKSDAPARYLDFTLPTVKRTTKGKTRTVYEVPTKSTLSRNMVITHKGRNPHFIE